MPNHGDFASLLQLGVGLGIGIGVFRAPVDIRLRKLQRSIDDELSALEAVDTDFARQKRRAFFNFRLQLEELRSALEKVLWPFIVAALIAALANWALLLYVSFHSSEATSNKWQFLYVYISVVHYAIILFALECFARINLDLFSKKIDEKRAEKLQPMLGSSA